MQAGLKKMNKKRTFVQRNVKVYCLIKRIAFLRNKTNCLFFFMMIQGLRKAILYLVLIILLFSYCTVKRGCPATAAAVGAERILSGDPKAAKAIKHGRKFKS